MRDVETCEPSHVTQCPPPILYLFTSPSPPSNCPDVPCTPVFTPGLLLLGATQAPPQMCPVNLDKEEHGRLITMLLRNRMPPLRDRNVILKHPSFLKPSPPASGYVSIRSVRSALNMHNTWERNGIIKRVYRCNVCGDHLKCESCYTVKQIVL